MDLGILRTQLHGPLISGHRLIDTPQAQVDPTPITERFRHIGTQGQGLVEAGQGIGEPSFQAFHNAQIVVGFDKMGRQGQSLLQASGGLLQALEAGQGLPQVVEGLKMVGILFQHPVEVRFGLLKMPALKLHQAQTVVGGIKCRIETQGLPVVMAGGLPLPHLLKGDGQIVVQGGIFIILFKPLPEERYGCFLIALALPDHPFQV